MWQNPQFPADLATFTEEILNGKLFCSVWHWRLQWLMGINFLPIRRDTKWFSNALSLVLSSLLTHLHGMVPDTEEQQ